MEFSKKETILPRCATFALIETERGYQHKYLDAISVVIQKFFIYDYLKPSKNKDQALKLSLTDDTTSL